MHYLVTGHTGFKGAWLTLLLTHAGHDVSGLALDPEPGALFERARVAADLQRDVRLDINQPDAVHRAFAEVQPDAVIHMAAQPLVRESYVRPRETFATNVMGTLNVVEAAQASESVRGLVVITTDKVYRNMHQRQGYVESDALGGHDPYSASKAMADILVQSWTASLPMPPTAIARAGNVIGGGDVCKDRLLPDLLAAFTADVPARIRHPGAVRPWQHVLDCLNGYAMLTDAVVRGEAAGEWNFGPDEASFMTVADVAELAARLWGADAAWESQPGDHPHEAELLALDAAKARGKLGWNDRLSFEEAVAWTVDWTRRVDAGGDARAETLRQIDDFAARGDA